MERGKAGKKAIVRENERDERKGGDRGEKGRTERENEWGERHRMKQKRKTTELVIQWKR